MFLFCWANIITAFHCQAPTRGDKSPIPDPDGIATDISHIDSIKASAPSGSELVTHMVPCNEDTKTSRG